MSQPNADQTPAQPIPAPSAAVFLPQTLQTRIFAHLEATFPNEGGGFLLGSTTATPNSIIIHDTINIANVFAADEQWHRYAMRPQDWAQLEDAADARGLTLVGYYHSHPNAAPIPSVYDGDHALPNFVYLITEVRDGHAKLAWAWRLRHDRQGFDPLPLQITDSDAHGQPLSALATPERSDGRADGR
jgi:proteasome lid subunit RPN8/RPN11